MENSFKKDIYQESLETVKLNAKDSESLAKELKVQVINEDDWYKILNI